MDDRFLIKRWLDSGEEDAFEELWSRYRARVWGVACRYFKGDTERASDVTQDVLIRLCNRLHQFEGRSKFSSWLYRVVYNECAMHYRDLSALKNQPRKTPGVAYENEDDFETHLQKRQAVNAVIQIVRESPKQDLLVAICLGTENNKLPKRDDQCIDAIKSEKYRARMELQDKLRGYI